MISEAQRQAEEGLIHVIYRMAEVLREAEEDRKDTGITNRSIFAELCKGRFQGEHLSTRYYWTEEEQDWIAGDSNLFGQYRAWRILPLERVIFSFPQDAVWFVAMENGQGFVTGEHMTESAFTSLMESVEAEEAEDW